MVGQLVTVTWNTPFNQLKAYQTTFGTLCFLFGVVFTVDKIFAIDKFGDPTQPGFDRGGGVVDIVAVEAEAHLQTQCVARTQTDIFQSHVSTRFPESGPQLVGVFVGYIDLAATCTGITGCRNNGILNAGHFGLDKGVVGEVLHIGFRAELLNNLHRQRTLNRQLGNLIRSVVKLFARGETERFALFAKVFPILVRVGSVDYQQKGFGIDAVNQNVIDNTSTTIRQAGVLYLAIVERCYIVRGDMLQKINGTRTFDPNLAHVADIEYTGLFSNRVVFIVDAAELNGHVVSRKFCHAGTVFDMILGKRGGFHMFDCYL